MMFKAAAVLLAIGSPVTAFTIPTRSRTSPSALAATAVVTGPKGKAAKDYDDDIRLTLLIIRDHEARSTTTSSEQMIQQMETQDETAEPVDVSIPYDAAAQLAYEASDKSQEYDAFKKAFEAAAVADVIAKNEPPVDVSVPYDAAAQLAYEASDKSQKYDAFKKAFEAAAVADVIAKNEPPVDVSVPYDAAAQLAYEASDKSQKYDAFKKSFEAAAVADVIAKKAPAVVEKKAKSAPAIDVSVPYDAAAKLAYEASDKSEKYDAFRKNFEKQAVADVVAKSKTPVAA